NTRSSPTVASSLPVTGVTWADYPRRSMNRRFPRRCSCTMPSRADPGSPGEVLMPRPPGSRRRAPPCRSARVSPGARGAFSHPSAETATTLSTRRAPCACWSSSRRPSPLRAGPRNYPDFEQSRPAHLDLSVPLAHLAPRELQAPAGVIREDVRGRRARAHLRCCESADVCDALRVTLRGELPGRDRERRPNREERPDQGQGDHGAAAPLPL